MKDFDPQMSQIYADDQSIASALIVGHLWTE
jgi:hypothetical protein